MPTLTSLGPSEELGIPTSSCTWFDRTEWEGWRSRHTATSHTVGDGSVEMRAWMCRSSCVYHATIRGRYTSRPVTIVRLMRCLNEVISCACHCIEKNTSHGSVLEAKSDFTMHNDHYALLLSMIMDRAFILSGYRLSFGIVLVQCKKYG